MVSAHRQAVGCTQREDQFAGEEGRAGGTPEPPTREEAEACGSGGGEGGGVGPQRRRRRSQLGLCYEYLASTASTLTNSLLWVLATPYYM